MDTWPGLCPVDDPILLSDEASLGWNVNFFFYLLLFAPSFLFPFLSFPSTWTDWWTTRPESLNQDFLYLFVFPAHLSWCLLILPSGKSQESAGTGNGSWLSLRYLLILSFPCTGPSWDGILLLVRTYIWLCMLFLFDQSLETSGYWMLEGYCYLNA